jgi:hypothetical protein
MFQLWSGDFAATACVLLRALFFVSPSSFVVLVSSRWSMMGQVHHPHHGRRRSPPRPRIVVVVAAVSVCGT